MRWAVKFGVFFLETVLKTAGAGKKEKVDKEKTEKEKNKKKKNPLDPLKKKK